MPPQLGDLFGQRSRLYVLLVEDDRDTREVLTLILEGEGFTVTQASDGLDALDRLGELRRTDPEAPYAIVLDYMMPRLSGAEFRQRQMADPQLAAVPVILVSAVAELARRAQALRPFAVLQKPVDPDELSDTVRRACEEYLAAR